MKRIVFLCAVVLSAADPESLVRQVAAYDYGKDPAAVRELEALVLHSGPSLEKLLLSGLASAQTLAAKDAFCRNLAVAGGDAAVPKLAAMLESPETADMARYALEKIPGEKAGVALREALMKTTPPVQTGIVVSLGRRRDAASVKNIAGLLGSKDAALASAAAAAFGSIADPASQEALFAAPRTPAVVDALMAMADRIGGKRASDIYERLEFPESKGMGRESLRAALKGNSVKLQANAARGLARLDGAALAKELPNVPERARVQILAALTDSGQPGVRQVLLDAASNQSEAVRVASLNGLAKLGAAADVPMLAKRAAATSGDEQAAARFALGNIRGTDVDPAILQAIPGAEPKEKVELIRALGERGATTGAEVLLAAAADANRPVRVESVRALREIAGARHVPALLGLLSKAPNDTERRDLERTVASAIRRSKESSVADVVDSYQAATDPGVRISLLNVLSLAGDASALPQIRQALQDSNPDIQRAALNALSGWPSPEPMNDLLSLARSSTEPTRQILALRGYFLLVQLPSSRTPSETARLLQTAMPLATRPDEKRAVLAVVQRLVCPESLELAKSVLKDPQVAAEAQLAVTTLERALSFVK
jgi:HEAT repeat protein